MSGSTAGTTSPTTPAPVKEWVAPNIKISNPYYLTNENYAVWCKRAKVHLRNAGVWGVVIGTEPKPTGDDPYDNWTRKNYHALDLLIQMVSEDTFITQIGDAETASGAWKDLENMLDRKNVTSVMHPINALLDLKKDESTTWQAHIADFEARWNTIVTKVSSADSSSKAWLQGLRQCFSDTEYKAHLLLRTVPASLSNVVDNLQTKADITYTDVRTKLLDLQSESTTTGSGLIATSNKKKSSTSKSATSGKASASSASSASSKKSAPKDECTYCWKRNLTPRKHKHTECPILKKALEEKKASSGSASGSAKIAHDDISSGYAFIAGSADSPSSSGFAFRRSSGSSTDSSSEPRAFTNKTHEIRL